MQEISPNMTVGDNGVGDLMSVVETTIQQNERLKAHMGFDPPDGHFYTIAGILKDS
jgi:hypothetical protein